MRDRPIVVTQVDARMLRALLARRVAASASVEPAGADQKFLEDLDFELERAVVVDTVDMPPNVVSMQSRVRVADLDSGQRHEFVLVFPSEANVAANRISVLAPLGTAVLGYREGDDVEWIMPSGLRRLRIERVMPAC